MTETSTKTYQELEQDLEDIKETVEDVAEAISSEDPGAARRLEELLERIT